MRIRANFKVLTKSVSSGPAKRPGFSLVETLVVIVVISLLVVLITAAVQQARESSRRFACANNLRQIGVALQSYHTRVGCFPGGANGRSYSAHAMLLSGLEQTNVYNAINFTTLSSNGEAKANHTIMRTRIAVFICPSDPRGATASGTSYPASVGWNLQQYGWNGLFPPRPVTASEIRDGLSETIAFSEWILGTTGRHPKIKEAIMFIEPSLALPEEFDDFLRLCREASPETNVVSQLPKGFPWLDGNISTTLYHHNLPPNGNSCLNSGAFIEGALTAGSLHPQCVNSLFADGHVRMIKESVSLAVWRAISTRSSDEVIDVSGFSSNPDRADADLPLFASSGDTSVDLPARVQR